MRILLIEDDAALADGLIRALQGAGHLCDHLSRGLHAPAALASAPYDVMVLDLSLPDVDGLDLLSRLRNDGATLPVLILTARWRGGPHPRPRPRWRRLPGQAVRTG
jgi:DNA-binding response OmpR family regulator